MKVLLIGKKGQVGTSLDNYLFKSKFDFYACSKEELDITNTSLMLDKINEIKPDIIINASAYHVVQECENNPEKAFAINAIALKNLADYCRENNSLLVTYSTDYVFDGLKGKPYIETDKTNPLQMYGISKLAGEQIAMHYNPKTIILRTCGVFGGKLGSRAKRGNFILTILRDINGKDTLEVSSEQIVSPTYSEDLAKATLKLIKKNPDYGIYHVVNTGYCSWTQFASEIVKITKSKCRIIPVDRGGQSGSLRRPLFSALSNKKASLLGVIMPDWQDAVKRYLQFILKA